MKAEVTEVATCRYKLDIEVAAEKVNEEFDRAFDTLKRQVQIKGFRRGHTPRRVIEKRYGEEVARDVTGQLFQKSFMDALKSKELHPLGEPKMDYESLAAKSGQAFAYTAEIDVRPQFDLPEYKGLKLTEKVEPVSEEQITERLESLVKGFASYNESAEPFKKGDSVTCDLVMAEGANEIMKREDFRLPSEADRLMGLEIAGLQEALLGLKCGDSKSFTVEVPESYYQKDAAGKTVEIRAALKKIETPSYPAIDDELAKRVGFESLPGLKERVKQNFEAENKQKARGELEKDALEELLGRVSFALPEEYIARQTEARIERQKQMLGQLGGEQDAQKLADLEKEARAEAEKTTRQMIVLDTIADKENLEITQEDVWQHIQRLAYMYGMKPEQMLKQIQQMNAMMHIAQEVREEKVVKFLLDNAQITVQESAS